MPLDDARPFYNVKNFKFIFNAQVIDVYGTNNPEALPGGFNSLNNFGGHTFEPH